MAFVVEDFNGDPLNFEDELAVLASERHKCAHVASHGVTTVWLRAVPDQILRYAASFDSLASVSAHLLRTSDPRILRDERWMNDARVKLRFVRERARGYAEVVEGKSRATRTSTDCGLLVAGASGRCGASEVLVEQNRAGAVVAWSVPSVD
jgi:hypothetical protein